MISAASWRDPSKQKRDKEFAVRNVKAVEQRLVLEKILPDNFFQKNMDRFPTETEMCELFKNYTFRPCI